MKGRSVCDMHKRRCERRWALRTEGVLQTLEQLGKWQLCCCFFLGEPSGFVALELVPLAQFKQGHAMRRKRLEVSTQSMLRSGHIDIVTLAACEVVLVFT